MGEYWRKTVIFSTFLLVSVGAQQFVPPGLHAPVQGRQLTRGNDGRHYLTSPEDIHVEFFQTAASQHQLGGRMDGGHPVNHASISPSSSVDSPTEHLPEASKIRPMGTGSLQLQLPIPFMTHHHQQSYPVTFESYPVSNFVFQAQAPAQFQPAATTTQAPAIPTTQRPKHKARKLKNSKTRLTKEEKAQRGGAGSGYQRTTVDYKEHSPSDLKVFSIPIDALEDEDLYYDDEQEEDASEEGGVEAGEGADQEEDMEKVRQTISSLNENTRARSKAKSSSAGRRGNGKPKAAAKPTEDEEDDGADVNGEDDLEATGDISESSGGSGYQQTPKAKSSGGRKSGGGNGSSRERTSGSSSKPKNKNRSKSPKGQVVSTLRVEITGARKAINKGNVFQTAPSGASAPAPAAKVEGAGGSFSSGQNGGYGGAGENAGGSSGSAQGPTQAEQDYILGKFIPALLDYQRQNNGNQIGGTISQSGPGQQLVQQGTSGKFSSGQAGNGAAQQSVFFNNNPGQAGQAQFFSVEGQVSGNPAQPQVSYGSPQPAAHGHQQVSNGFPQQQNQFTSSVSGQSISAQPQVQTLSGQSGSSQSSGAPQISYGSPQSLNQYLASSGQRQVLSSSSQGHFSSGQSSGQTVSNTPSVSYGFPQAPTQFIQGSVQPASGSGQQVSSGQTAGQIYSNSPSTTYGSPQQQSQIEIVQAISQDQLFSTFSSNGAASGTRQGPGSAGQVVSSSPSIAYGSPQVQFVQARPQGSSVSAFSTGQSAGSGQGSPGQSVTGSPSVAYGSPQPQIQFVQARPEGPSVASGFSAGQSSGSGLGSSSQSASGSPSVAYGSPQAQLVQFSPQSPTASAFSSGQFSSGPGQASSGGQSSGSPSVSYGSPQQIQFVSASPQGQIASAFSSGQISPGSPQIIQSFPTAQPSAIPTIFRVTAQPVLPRAPALSGGSGFGFSNPSTPRPFQVTAASPTLQSYSAGSQAPLGRFNTGSSSGSSSSGGSTGSQEFFKSAIFVPTSTSSSESDSGSGSSSFSTATNGIIQGISNLFSRFASSASPTAASPTPSAVTPASSPQNTVQSLRSQFALTSASGIEVGNNGNSGYLSPSQSTAAPVPAQQIIFPSQGSTPASYTGGFIAPVALSATSASPIPSSGTFSQQYNTFSSNALNAKTNAFITPSVATAGNSFGPIGGTSFSSEASGFSSGSSNSGFSTFTPRPFFSSGPGSSSSLPIQISPSQASAMLKDELSLPNDPAQRQQLRNALQLVTRFAVSQIAVPNESSASGTTGRQINGFSSSSSSVSGGYPNYIQKRKDDDESETIPIDTDADSVSFDAFAEQVYNNPEAHIPNHPSPLIPADASADITVHA